MAAVVVGAVGTLMTSAMTVAAVRVLNVAPTSSALTAVRADEIEAAAASLPANTAIGMVADAKSCKVRLAQIMLVKRADAAPGDTVRIRSGAYLSPAFKVGEQPQRVAIPYPAPFEDGKGEIAVLGEGHLYTVSLSPPRSIPDLEGIQRIPVFWSTKSPC